MKNKSIIFAALMLVLLTISVKSKADETKCKLVLTKSNIEVSYKMHSLNECIKAGEYYKRHQGVTYRCDLL